jgi:TonB family protein
MPGYRSLIRVALPVLFPISAAWAQELPNPIELAKAANEATDLAKAGPYRLDGNAVVFSGGKQVATGHVRVDRDGELSREEIHFADYDEVDVSDGKVVYVSRKTAGIELAMYLGDLDQRWQFSLPQDAATGGLKKKRSGSTSAFCFETKIGKDERRVTCFDELSRLLMSNTSKDSQETREFTFSNYRDFGDRHFPQIISFALNGARLFEIRDISVDSGRFEDDHFAAPENAKVFHTCRHPQPAKKVKDVNPEYPAPARAGHIQGDVWLWGVIDTDGKFANLKVISGDPVLSNSAFEAAKQWRYQPAMCPSGPVETGTRVKISFSIR